MPQFEALLKVVRDAGDYEEKARAMQYVGNVLKNAKNIPATEKKYIADFTLSEMRRLTDAIPEEKSYKEKCKMFFYEDSLLMAFTFSTGDAKNLQTESVDVVKRLVMLVAEERVLENAIDEMFRLDAIDKPDLKKVLDIIKPVKDEYRRGMLYQGLHEYADKIKNFTDGAKCELAEYVARDMERILEKAEAADEEATDGLEFAADVCRYFINDKIAGILERIMTLNANRVRYYALDTLLQSGAQPPAQAIRALADDLVYACLTHAALKRHGKSNLFPKELDNPEYLAKSDLTHWLTYPTELNKQPDETELLGSVNVKKQTYYVFKFKSDSDNLSDELKNKWLIGWSADGGNTFSNFDPLSAFEKKTPQKTVKYIAKKLLK